MSIKITEAIFRKNDIELPITPSDMDKQSYESYYKGYLFCPTPNCNAHLVFIEGNIQVSHFRTWRRSTVNKTDVDDKGKHIEGCPNSISYEESEKNRRRYVPDYKYNVSDEHISSVLRRAYNAFTKKQNGSEVNGGGKISSTNQTGFTSGLIDEISGTAILFGQGEDITKGREPRIPVRLLENISEQDYFQVRCIIGFVSNVYLEENYASL